MAKRTAKLACAMVACVVAVPVMASAQSADGGADECLPGPKGVAPQGQHWYYRVDRASKRQCWYLREQVERSSHTAASAASAAPAAAAAPTASTQPPRSTQKPKAAVRAGPLEDARAEWPEPRLGNAPVASPAPQPAPVLVAGAQSAPITASQDAAAPQPAVGSRWPDGDAASAPAAPSPAARSLADARSPVKPVRRSSTSPGAAPAPADPPADSGSQWFQKLLLVMLGALAIAGVVVAAIFRFGARYRARLFENRPRGRVNWDAATAGSVVQLSETAVATAAAPWTDAVNEAGTQPVDYAVTSGPAARRPRSDEAGAASSLAPQVDDPADADIDQITAMLEQLIKEGPKLDRMLSPPGADGPQAASGARA